MQFSKANNKKHQNKIFETYAKLALFIFRLHRATHLQQTALHQDYGNDFVFSTII